MPRLSTKGITADMKFKCCECDEEYTGQDIIDGKVWLYIIERNEAEPLKSVFRCECCQEDWNEKNRPEEDD
jgi:hypothetical protein